MREHSRGSAFLASLSREVPDAVILDVMLPDIDGMEVCRRLRTEPRGATLPVIMLTARVAEGDRVLGLEIGADDYVTKPFSPKELAARVRAVLRRSGRRTGRGAVRGGRHRHRPRWRSTVVVADRRVDLTASEFRLLDLLASRAGQVFAREQILDGLWGDEKSVTDRSVDVHIRYLREKLGDGGGADRERAGRGVQAGAMKRTLFLRTLGSTLAIVVVAVSLFAAFFLRFVRDASRDRGDCRAWRRPRSRHARVVAAAPMPRDTPPACAPPSPPSRRRPAPPHRDRRRRDGGRRQRAGSRGHGEPPPATRGGRGAGGQGRGARCATAAPLSGTSCT